jgi:uncharacterized membrane protein
MGQGNQWRHADFVAVKQVVELVVSVLFSTVALSGAMFIILSKQYNDEYTKWAFGMVGLILGYWLAHGKNGKK